MSHLHRFDRLRLLPTATIPGFRLLPAATIPAAPMLLPQCACVARRGSTSRYALRLLLLLLVIPTSPRLAPLSTSTAPPTSLPLALLSTSAAPSTSLRMALLPTATPPSIQLARGSRGGVDDNVSTMPPSVPLSLERPARQTLGTLLFSDRPGAGDPQLCRDRGGDLSRDRVFLLCCPVDVVGIDELQLLLR